MVGIYLSGYVSARVRCATNRLIVFRLFVFCHVYQVRDKLDAIGFTERTLFPGLDGLCNYLRRYYTPRDVLTPDGFSPSAGMNFRREQRRKGGQADDRAQEWETEAPLPPKQLQEEMDSEKSGRGGVLDEGSEGAFDNVAGLEYYDENSGASSLSQYSQEEYMERWVRHVEAQGYPP